MSEESDYNGNTYIVGGVAVGGIAALGLYTYKSIGATNTRITELESTIKTQAVLIDTILRRLSRLESVIPNSIPDDHSGQLLRQPVSRGYDVRGGARHYQPQVTYNHGADYNQNRNYDPQPQRGYDPQPQRGYNSQQGYDPQPQLTVHNYQQPEYIHSNDVRPRTQESRSNEKSTRAPMDIINAEVILSQAKEHK